MSRRSSIEEGGEQPACLPKEHIPMVLKPLCVLRCGTLSTNVKGGAEGGEGEASRRLAVITYLYDEQVTAVIGEAVGHDQSHVGDERIGPAVVSSV